MVTNNQTLNPVAISIVWPISLYSVPIIAIGLLITASIFGDIYHSKVVYVMTMWLTFIWFVVAGMNIVFSFYSIVTLWSKFNNRERLKYVIVCSALNVLGSYYISKEWLKFGVNPYNINKTKKYDIIAIVFYFLIAICLFFSMRLSRVHF